MLPDLDRRDIDVTGRELDWPEAEVTVLASRLREFVDAVVVEGIQIGNWEPFEAIGARVANIVAVIAEARSDPAGAVSIG